MYTRVIWIFHKNTAKYSFSLAILSILKRSLPQPNMNICMHQQQKYVNLIQLLWINHQKGLPLSLTIEGTVGHQFWLRLATKFRLYKLSKVNSCSKFSRFRPVEDVTTNQRLNGKSFVPRCGLELLQSEKGLEPKSSLLEIDATSTNTLYKRQRCTAPICWFWESFLRTQLYSICQYFLLIPYNISGDKRSVSASKTTQHNP